MLGKLKSYINNNIYEEENNKTIFSLYSIFNFIIPFVLWESRDIQSYFNIILHIIGIILPVLVYLLKDNTLKLTKTFNLFFWAFSMLYCLPFFSFYLLINHENNFNWMCCYILNVFILSFFVKWRLHLLLSLLGYFCAYILSFYLYYDTFINKIYDSIIYTYVISLFMSSVLFFNKNKYFEQKQKEEKNIGHIMAHEVRTPLSVISACLAELKVIFPTLIRSYNLCSESELIEKNLCNKNLNHHKKLINNALYCSDKLFHFISMYLNNLNNMNKANELHKLIKHSIQDVLDRALENYPFTEDEKKILKIEKICDFKVFVDINLAENIIHNLIKNSFYSIKKKNKGHITISCESPMNLNYNILTVKDTGYGIEKKNIPKIFDKFYTDKKRGSGIGLFFCKKAMNLFGGQIKCKALLYKYTEFTLFFPKSEDFYEL